MINKYCVMEALRAFEFQHSFSRKQSISVLVAIIVIINIHGMVCVYVRIYMVLGIEPKVLQVLGKPSNHWAISQDLYVFFVLYLYFTSFFRIIISFDKNRNEKIAPFPERINIFMVVWISGTGEGNSSVPPCGSSSQGMCSPSQLW